MSEEGHESPTKQDQNNLHIDIERTWYTFVSCHYPAGQSQVQYEQQYTTYRSISVQITLHPSKNPTRMLSTALECGPSKPQPETTMRMIKAEKKGNFNVDH